MQRHHLLPYQLLSARCFGRMFGAIGSDRIGFDDFRTNGLLLPGSDAVALRLKLPLHRGPHRHYTALVAERVGQVEASWIRLQGCAPETANCEALMRLGLLQRALRRRLVSGRHRLKLNRRDPLGAGLDFSELDAMAESLWSATMDQNFS